MYAVKQPGGKWKQFPGIPSLEKMQEIVGGWIEMAYYPFSDKLTGVNLIVNEEGKLMQLDANIHIGHDILVGPVLAVRIDDEGGTATLQEGDVAALQEVLA